MPAMGIMIPRIAGDWRLLYKPDTTGCYVNDHSLVRGPDGSWHLFGITSHQRDGDRAEQERYFTHGRGESLVCDGGFTELGVVCNNGVRAWAPSVVSDGWRYYMHYGPSPTRFATSYELSHWMEQPVELLDDPLDACHRDHMVLRLGDGSWLMYATGINGKYGVVSVYRSDDLVRWRFVRYALETAGDAPLNPPWGATESPFVVSVNSGFYLLVTYTDCRPENYHQTLVFRSDDPTDFGQYRGDADEDRVVARLHAHAPEVVRDDDGQWYITTCGWPGYGVPIEGGVAIAPLDWSG